MMLATRFRQALMGICKSLAGLPLAPEQSAPVPPPANTLSSHSPRRSDTTNRFRLGSFNVQSLGSFRKQYDTLPQDLQRYRIDVIGLQETKICTLDKRNIGDYILLTLPAAEERHGVGFAISPRISPYLHRYWAHSDRIGVLQLKMPHAGLINIITAYSPHSGRPMTDVDRFYVDLSALLYQLPRRSITFVTGDFNAKLGQRQPGDAYMGIHGRGIRNRNGHALADLCFSHHLFATNTGFRKPARYRTTWTQRRTDHCIYNQIDYILCPQNCRRLCMDARSWGGTLTASDHKLVTADFILDASTHRKRFSHHVRRQEPTRLQLSRDRLVHDELVRAQYTEALKVVLSTQDVTPGRTVLQRWEDIFQSINKVATEVIGLASNTKQRRRYHDQELQQLSEAQRDLQLRLYNDCAENITELRKARNQILHRIKYRCRDIARRILDEKVTRIENMSDSARMYAAVRDINTSTPQPLLLLDQDGKYILHQRTANQLVKTHFQQQFYDPERPTVAPDREPKPLSNPITPDEVAAAFRRLNNGRASGPDDIPAELLKYGAPVLAPRIAELINTSFEQGLPLALGEGTLLCLPKPNKPRGQCSSLRPIVLLNTIRKAISLIVLARISPAVDTYLSSHQSGFRKHRSTADAVWAHKWLCARVQRYREVIHVLGIDLSRAFDTIDREKLLDVLRTFLEDDDIRLIKLLLVDTTLSLRTGSTTLPPFYSNIGTPQGDSLSPVLFVVYLDAALRDLADHIAVPRNLLEQMIVYADDADFICHDPELAQRIQTEAPEVLARWSLQMNASKTELTILQRRVGPSGSTRHARAEEEAWRSTRKLGSLLGDSEDLTRRKQLATAALRRLWNIWLRPQFTSDSTRIRLYNCYVLPILLYNCGTWALTPAELASLESFHRRQLRSVLNVRYPQRMSNAVLYEICQERPLRHRVTAARWRLFGHILRRPDTPAYVQTAAYFAPSDKGVWRGRLRTTLPTVLNADLVSSGYAYRLRTRADLEQLRSLANAKSKWKALERAIVDALPAKGDPTYADTTLCRRLANLSLAQA